MGDPLPPDPYKALGVTKNCDSAAVRTAYKKLVLKCHPDKFQDETIKAQKQEEFHQVQQAYELLVDDQKRAKYDEKVKLAELRAEVLKESGEARRAAGAYDHSPRTFKGYYEPRREPVVEIRPSYYPRESPRQPPPRPSPRHEEHDYRSTPRRSDEFYDDFRPSSSSRKASSGHTYKDERAEDSKSRAQRRWKDAYKTVSSKASDKTKEYENKSKSRDKDRRGEYQAKRTYYAAPRVDSESETESDVEIFMASPRSGEAKRRPEPPRRSRRDEDSRRKSDDTESSDDDHQYHKSNHNFVSAAEYIMKSRGKAPAEREERRRPTLGRGKTAPPPTAPTAPTQPTPVVDSSAKRSSARRATAPTSKSSPKEKNIEIVEAAPTSRRAEYDSNRIRPNLPTAATSPAGSKGQPTLNNLGRAATFEPRASEKQPSARRAQTSPLGAGITSPSGHVPHKSSPLRPPETHDSGYSSPGTDNQAPQKPLKTTYKVVQHDSDDSDASRPTTVLIDPEARHREPSPRTQSHRYDRPSIQPRNSARHVPPRSATFDDRATHPRVTPLSRAATDLEDRGRHGLFGEVTPEHPRGAADVRSPPSGGYKVRYGRKYSEDDIVYGDYQRGRDDSRVKDRDAYPYERSGRTGHSPGLGSRTTSGSTKVPVH